MDIQASKLFIFFLVFIMLLSNLIFVQIFSGNFCLENVLRHVIINQSKLNKMLPFHLKTVYYLLSLLQHLAFFYCRLFSRAKPTIFTLQYRL